MQQHNARAQPTWTSSRQSQHTSQLPRPPNTPGITASVSCHRSRSAAGMSVTLAPLKAGLRECYGSEDAVAVCGVTPNALTITGTHPGG